MREIFRTTPSLSHGFLANDDAREEIAAAGRRRTIWDHNYERRAQQIKDILEEVLASAR